MKSFNFGIFDIEDDNTLTPTFTPEPIPQFSNTPPMQSNPLAGVQSWDTGIKGPNGASGVPTQEEVYAPLVGFAPDDDFDFSGLDTQSIWNSVEGK